MKNIQIDITLLKEEKGKYYNKLIENEKCIQNGERIFTEKEMNTILVWIMTKYV